MSAGLRQAGLAAGTGVIVAMAVTLIMVLAMVLDGGQLVPTAPAPAEADIIGVELSVSGPRARGCNVVNENSPLPIIDTGRCLASEHTVTVE